MTPEAPSAAQVLDAVLALAREADQAEGEAATAETITRVASALAGANQGALGVVRDGQVVTLAALMPPRQPVGSQFPVGFGVAGWVAATGRAATIDDVREDKRYVTLPYPEVRSFLAIPLQCNDDLVGVLSLGAWRASAFAPGSAEALVPLAEQAALLLRRARADQHTQARLAALEHAAHEGLVETLHELKAPLHAVAGFVDLVASEQAGPLTERQRDFLRTAHAECRRLQQTLAGLVEAGAAQLRPVQLDELQPTVVVEACVQRFRGQAARRDVLVRAQVDPHAQPVAADAAAIDQVLANFMQNALRLVPAGSDIVVETTAEPGWTRFSVADRGPGLEEADLEAVFAPFHQADTSPREPGNVGLGLAVARRVVAAHGGRIWAERRSGGGARFCFALPAATAPVLINAAKHRRAG